MGWEMEQAWGRIFHPESDKTSSLDEFGGSDLGPDPGCDGITPRGREVF
jgi:hypothetical protein